MNNLRIEQLHTLDVEQYEPMRLESEQLGFGFVTKLLTEYGNGKNRFDKAGEALFAVFNGNSLIGVGGVNRDPYVTDGNVGRVRHVYVMETARRQNAGTFLLQHLIHHAQQHFTLLRLRTMTPEASRFYEALGFVHTPNGEAATHVMVL